MPNFGSLSIAASGMRAAQVNLAVTGHNVSNSEIPGFSRQRIVQNTSFSRDVGIDGSGATKFVGMGTNWSQVHQIRNEFLDFTYRQNVGMLQFYTSMVQTGLVIESLIGELYGAYNFQSVLNDMWFSIQELTSDPSGVDTRMLFLATVNSFLTKAQEVQTGLFEYQHNLDQQIRSTVSDINSNIAEIERLNRLIRTTEQGGDRANDFRDQRNLLVDRLAELIPLDVFTAPNGDVNIFSQGHELLANGNQTLMGLRFISNEFSFVEPVLTSSREILRADTPPDQFISFTNYRRGINNAQGNDQGKLNALILARGTSAMHYASPDVPRPQLTQFWDGGSVPPNAFIDERAATDAYNAAVHNWNAHMWSVQHATIPQVQMQIDKIVNRMAHMINDALTGRLREVNPNYDPSYDPDTYPQYARFRYVFRNADYSPRIPLDADHNHGIPLFIRDIDRNETTMPWPITDSDPSRINTVFTTRNLRINPAFLETNGHNRLALSLSGADNDTDLLVALQQIWMDGGELYGIPHGSEWLGIQDAYIRMTGSIATQISEANSYVRSQTQLVIQTDNMRQSIKGVSMDEELNAMLRFQFAFQAASRVFNVIDGMIDQVVNRTGRVGM
jgi:flagellar hook-associated protein 1 FlgK